MCVNREAASGGDGYFRRIYWCDTLLVDLIRLNDFSQVASKLKFDFNIFHVHMLVTLVF